MPTLRDAQKTSRADVTLYPGTGKPASEVKLTSTNIKPYMMDPGLAQSEADTTKARYGGSAIQDSPGGSAPFARPTEASMQQPVADFSDRNRYENGVLKMIGGNPFERDPVRELNKITQNEMPKIFETIFGGQLAWADRGRMDPNQVKHFDNEVKRFRAHVAQGIDADIKTQINTYNNLMTRFDNDRKYYEANLKRVEAASKDLLKTRRQDYKERVSRYDDLNKSRMTINKQIMDTLLKYQEISNVGGPDSNEAMAVMDQYNNLLAEKNRLQQEISAIAGRPSRPAENGDGSRSQSATGKKVVERRLAPDGRKLVKYEDGEIAVIQ